MMTYIWANTSSMNRFPQEQDCPNSSDGQGSTLVKCPYAALRTGKKDGGQRGKDFFCGLHTVHPAYGTLHAASLCMSHDTKVFK